MASSAPETQYVETSGPKLAYQVLGEGPVDIVFVPGWLSHLGLLWENPVAAAFLRGLASFSRLILFDKRGAGLSERTSAVASLDARILDMQSVMDAVGSRSAVLFGSSEAGLACTLFAATEPERVRALVLHATFPGALSTMDDFLPTKVHRPIVDQLEHCVENAWGTGETLKLFAPSSARLARHRTDFGRFEAAAASPSEALAGLRWARQIDVRSIIPSIHVPTLVLHREKDSAVPVESGRWIAEHLPGARYIELPGDDHMFFLGGASPLVQAVKEFVATCGEPAAAPSVRVAGIVSIAVPTADAKRAEQTIEHALRELGGRALPARERGERTLLTATFARMTSAVRAAVVAGQALRAAGIAAATAAHVGEVRAGDQTGHETGQASAVAACDGLALQCAVGEVEVTKALVDLVPGGGFRFVASSRSPAEAPISTHSPFRVELLEAIPS